MNRMLPLLALGSSAVLFWFGSGLQPVWWCAWIAPMPMLALAVRVKAPFAFTAASLAWFIGALNQWHYLHGLIQIPVPVTLIIVAVPALIFGLATLLWRRLFLRGALIQASLAFAAMIVCFNFVLQRLSPHSTFGNPAYSQMDVLPLLQVASLAGIAGILFLLCWLPAALVAAFMGTSASPRHRVLAAISALLLCVTLSAWGLWRLSAAPAQTVKVGLIAGVPDQDLAGYARGASQLIDQGAKLVVIPEKIARLTDRELAEAEKPLRDAARRGAIVIMGVERWSPTQKFNEARVFSISGELSATYEKHHMIPALESTLTAGATRTWINDRTGKWGVAICKDMDFPLLSREYGNDGVGLLIVPAWDFNVDAWLHSRMAILRGVESGFSIARSAKEGRLTLSDNRGRVLAEAVSDQNQPATMLGEIPVRHDATLYARWGDWFSWLTSAALLALIFTTAPAYSPSRTAPTHARR